MEMKLSTYCQINMPKSCDIQPVDNGLVAVDQ